MKRLIITSVSAIMISILATINVFAIPFIPDSYTSVNIDSKLLPPGVKQSKVTESAKARGEFWRWHNRCSCCGINKVSGR